MVYSAVISRNQQKLNTFKQLHYNAVRLLNMYMTAIQRVHLHSTVSYRQSINPRRCVYIEIERDIKPQKLAQKHQEEEEESREGFCVYVKG